MKIVKTCVYRSNTINLLPTLLLTPMYRVCRTDKPFSMSAANAVRQHNSRLGNVLAKPAPYWTKAGFRLAFKVACLHIGIEVHYRS